VYDRDRGDTGASGRVSLCGFRCLTLKSFHLWNETFVMVFLVLTAGRMCFLPDQWSRWRTALWVLTKALKDVHYTFPVAFAFPHLKRIEIKHTCTLRMHISSIINNNCNSLSSQLSFWLAVWSPALQLLSAPTKSPFPSSHRC